MFSSLVSSINNILWSYVLIIVLVGCGLWFTFTTRMVQLRWLPEMLRLLKSGVGEKVEGGAVSSFQAFCVSTASRVGVGNIAGVALAIALGGPGAVFWMWVIAFLGCATGFVESTLAQIYKLRRADGSFHGGPAYYIQNALGQPAVAKLFAILISVTFGLIYVSVQANTIVLSLETAFDIPPLWSGIGIAILTALVIFGGLKRIASFTEFLVPVMATLYLLTAIVVILMNLEKLPGVIALIFHDAFSPQAAVAGGLSSTILTGIKRGLFSNEAGEGSVPNAAATADVSHPVKQGLFQAFGVYVDTWLVCSATAFIVLLTEQYTIGGNLTGIALAQASLTSLFGPLAAQALAFMIFLFAFSSVVGNYYYGEINLAFFEFKTRVPLTIFRILVVCFVIFGSVAAFQLVWDLADVFMGLICLTNLYAVARLYPYALIALKDYAAQKKAGVKEPVFYASTMPNEKGIVAWPEKK